MEDINSQIKKIALGTVQFGLDYGISNNSGKTPSHEVGEILSFCKANNIDTLDTAFGYGDSEKDLGQFDLSAFKIVSKFLDNKSSKGLYLDKQLEQSLEYLNVPRIYGYLGHRPLLVTNRDWKCLQELKKEGVIKKIGFSFNKPDEVDIVLNNGFIPDLVQAPFNYLDNRFTQKLRFLKENFKTEIHTRSVFLQGLFFMKTNELPLFFEPLKNALQEIETIEYKAGALLRYVLIQPFIDKVVIGVNHKQQLVQNIAQVKEAEVLKKFNSNFLPEVCLIPSNWPKL
jgi:aryl-alcohol dehydrogenase-like predicted oxidoreductase